MMTWDEEVRAGIDDVLDEYPPEVAAVLGHIPVMALETNEPFWGNWDGEVIRLFRHAFDAMPEPENRDQQIRDVLRHEFEHAMGIVHPGHEDMRPVPSVYRLSHSSVLALSDGRYAVIP